ncbi:MAG: type I-G CRISPR-associated protein, Cas3-extension family [Pseudonocardiaceae bacterium]
MTTDEVELPALDGTNPLGFLAALGVLDVLHRAGREPVLRWTADLVPIPAVRGVTDENDLVELIDADRARWQESVVLRGPSGTQLDDVKPPPTVHRSWAAEVAGTLDDTRADADLFCALLAEGAVDGKGNGKPTHLHFTAGQQKFLVMVRELASHVDAERIREAIAGPWREDSPLPSLSWSSQGERSYALRAVNPSSEKRRGVPGADWLAFLGLAFFPTCALTRNGGEQVSLKTTGCDRAWKRTALRWPLWTVSLERDTIWSLVGDTAVVGQDGAVGQDGRLSPAELHARGIRQVMQAPIRRSEQGGYGSFGGASVLVRGG